MAKAKRSEKQSCSESWQIFPHHWFNRSNTEMNKIFGVLLLCYLCLVVSLIIDVAANNEISLERPKRYLALKNNSHFYLKINFKNNMVPWNQLFAQAIGFRVNWDEPPETFHIYHHFSRRSIYDQMELLLDRNGLSGFHCVRRAICEMEAISQPNEMYHRILKILFRQKSSATVKWHNATKEDCNLSLSQCPLSVLDVSRFTDFV